MIDDTFDSYEWEATNLTLADGTVIEMAEFPSAWNENSRNIVAGKYFRPNETSLKQLVLRVVSTISGWMASDGVMDIPIECISSRLTRLVIEQKFAWNSPVWFNVGVHDEPQCSACFIQSVDDSMESILNLGRSEGMLFKGGSGTGTNLSNLRALGELLSKGGSASGPVSFMEGFDAWAGVIKSGGGTRRAAKMVILDIDHPDIIDFIDCKVEEERRALIMVEAGVEGDFNHPNSAYRSVRFQNANHSVRVSDSFMKAAELNGPWKFRWRTECGLPDKVGDAAKILKKIANAAWTCGDPGIQFDDTINSWHTCPSSGRINASNPCSEYMFLDNSACNLGSFNLVKYQNPDGSFDHETFSSDVDLVVRSMESLVSHSSYPTTAIRQNSINFRPLGLGYANLGAFLMRAGIPYDSKEARNCAAMITSLMTATAYATSADMAGRIGPFQGYGDSAESMMGVMRRHADAHEMIGEYDIRVRHAATKAWNEVLSSGSRNGFRNAQATVIAPTGTIGFMMGCDTTGIEPELALVKFKKMVGGGTIKIVNESTRVALENLEISDVKGVISHVENTGTMEGSSIDSNLLPIFDCAFTVNGGKRCIRPDAHMEMMAAVQPFVSGAISKTVNVPNSATIDDILGLYVRAWKMGLKSLAVYRDGSKGSQPLNTSSNEHDTFTGSSIRERLPDTRPAVTHKIAMNGEFGPLDIYVTVGLYPDGRPGELFIVTNKQGSVVRGLLDALATSVSLALQHGVPLDEFVKKFSYARFEPAGMTNHGLGYSRSIIDAVFRLLGKQFDGNHGGHVEMHETTCGNCGGLMKRAGTCFACESCGETTGCG